MTVIGWTGELAGQLGIEFFLLVLGQDVRQRFFR
jgi:hypothetical protein